MNLLIVDDEVLAIQGLVDDMDWKKLDFDEVFTANSYAPVSYTHLDVYKRQGSG